MTSGARLVSVNALASSMVSSRALVLVPVVTASEPAPPNSAGKPPPPRPPPAVEVEDTVNVLLPRLLIEASTAALEPVPTATRMITAATPIRMPSVVRADRSLFEVTPSTANLALSRMFIDATIWVVATGSCGSCETLVWRWSAIDPARRARGSIGARGRATSASCVIITIGPAGHVQLVEQGQDLLAAVGVQRARGLVGQQERRARDQSPGRSRPAAADRRTAESAGGRTRSARPTSSSASSAGVALGDWHARVGQRQLDVGQRGDARQQVERLEDEADLAVAHERQLVARRGRRTSTPSRR